METHPDTGADNLAEKWEEEWTKNLMEVFLDILRQKVSPNQMFYLHVCETEPTRLVVRKLDLKLPEVSHANYTFSRLLQKEIKRL